MSSPSRIVPRTCPTCGFPHEPPYNLPRTLGISREVDHDRYKCTVCGAADDAWAWSDPELDGDFEWPEAMERVE